MVLSQLQANSSQDLTSKITTAKWTGDVVQMIEHLLFKCLLALQAKSPETKPQSHKN
jgi:hypothetical protein